MSRYIRALFVSALATAVVVIAASLFSRRKPRLPHETQAQVPGEINADEMYPTQTDALMREFDALL